MKETEKKLTVIPDSFKCPAAGISEPSKIECSVYGSTDWFCPYAELSGLDQRRLNKDCKFAPAEIWKYFKNYKERCYHWFHVR